MKTLRLWTAILFAGACLPAMAFEDVDGSFSKIPAKRQEAIRGLLDLILTDGPASKLKRVKITRGELACGLIDAKNGLDDHVGFRRFLIDFKLQTLHIEGEGVGQRYEQIQSLMIKTCR